MATLKYKEPSPYKKPSGQRAPNEDYLYKMHEEDLALKCDLETNSVLNVAIFGVGRAGTIHLRNIVENPRCKLLYVVDDMESKWSKIRKHFRLDGVTFLTSKQAETVYRDAKVHAVVVASPTFTHEAIVIDALNAKKAVFCEKPIAETRANAEKCFEVAKKVGQPLLTAFNRRFDPSYVAVRDRVRNGEIGHVHTVKIVSRDSPLPTLDYLKTSGGIFHDCMVHDIDVMIWTLGEYPTSVAVQATANFPEIKAIDDFDTVAATLKFASGTLGMISLSRYACYGYDMRFEAFGPKGMVRAENEQPIHCVETQYEHNGPNAAPIWYSFASRFKNAYSQEMNHFFDIVLGKCESSIVTPKGVLAVSKIASACEESARTNKMVELQWSADELSEIY
ncbi:myo-inositol 2-dehydrogenase-like [Bradysia coprophila]|uniref:myo-inositol 2-dehydrogenase-like n=1 Tax=Bradysia coprophila TaxID=38358 RepID=UPI00187DA960|nr:myo-inositol 2-dehydrogenase-like [Bradysia coprophila]